MTAAAPTDPRRALQVRLAEGRRWTFDLLDPLDDEEMARQPHRIMSPLVWDLGHIGNYEELWFAQVPGRPLTDRSRPRRRLQSVRQSTLDPGRPADPVRGGKPPSTSPRSANGRWL